MVKQEPIYLICYDETAMSTMFNMLSFCHFAVASIKLDADTSADCRDLKVILLLRSLQALDSFYEFYDKTFKKIGILNTKHHNPEKEVT